MLHYNHQYDISNGIFLTFDSQLQTRLLHSRHGASVREKVKPSFPHTKYETMTKENFVMTCLYIMYDSAPSSYRGMITELHEVDQKLVNDFKYKILNYNDYMGRDIKFLKEEYGNATYQQVFRSLVDKKVEFFTVWFFIMFNPNINRDTIRKSRSLAHLLRKIESLMKFLTFRQESVERIGVLFKELEL